MEWCVCVRLSCFYWAMWCAAFEEARWFPVSESHAAAGRQTGLVRLDAANLATLYTRVTWHPHVKDTHMQDVNMLNAPLNEITIPKYKRFSRIRSHWMRQKCSLGTNSFSCLTFDVSFYDWCWISSLSTQILWLIGFGSTAETASTYTDWGLAGNSSICCQHLVKTWIGNCWRET